MEELSVEKELRSEKRESSKGGVLYTLISNDVENAETGLLFDMSPSGACIYTQDCITDEKVKVYFKGISQRPINADVMWCCTTIDNLYKAGLRFDN